jgi:hypothetical protein
VRPQIRTPGETTVGPPTRRSHARSVRWWRELILIAAFYAIYDAIRGVIAGSVPQAQGDAADLLRSERWIRLDPEHTFNNALQHISVLAIPACYFYATLHFIVTPAMLIWTYKARPAAYRNARTVLAIVAASALIGFWRSPTAPPRLLSDGGFHDTLAAYGNWGWWGSDASVQAGAAAIANQFAAMPSLNMAWAAWCGVTVFRVTSRRWLRVLAVAYPVLTALVVLGTANHYLADVLAGAGLWVLADFGVRHLARGAMIARRGAVAEAPSE